MKPVFETKEACETAIKTNPQYRGCSPTFVSAHYASAFGVSKGGWYLYSANKLAWTVN